jgi:hypothetical protein
VDLSRFDVGDIIEAPNAVTAMLVREGWAELVNGEKNPAKVE